MFLAAIVGSAIVAVGGAGAAPVNAKNALSITITCPSGVFEAVVVGNGEFSVAHAVASNSVLIPIAFGEFTGTFTDTLGNTETFTDPPIAKGSSSPRNGAVVECSFTIDVTFPDGTFTGEGDVTGFLTPVR